jgi:hypothetical protein
VDYLICRLARKLSEHPQLLIIASHNDLHLFQYFAGHVIMQLVEVLCYKPEGRGFDSKEVTGFFNWPNLSSRTMALGSTQTLIDMSTRNLPRGKGWPVCKANNLTAICELTV